MTVKAGWVTAMLHARSVEKSIEFYQLLGFKLIDIEGHSPLGWARLHCDDGSAIMLLLAEEPENIDSEKQAIMLVLYTEQLPTLRAQLLAQNVSVGEIVHPPWMPSGSLMLRDPDGYRVNVNHWGDAEHQAWLKQRDAKRTAGRLPAT
jgi:hypothetical protein